MYDPYTAPKDPHLVDVDGDGEGGYPLTCDRKNFPGTIHLGTHRATGIRVLIWMHRNDRGKLFSIFLGSVKHARFAFPDLPPTASETEIAQAFAARAKPISPERRSDDRYLLEWLVEPRYWFHPEGIPNCYSSGETVRATGVTIQIPPWRMLRFSAPCQRRFLERPTGCHQSGTSKGI